jgi:penicillin-binding protein 1A
MAAFPIRVARFAGLAALFVLAALAGALSGVLFAYADDLPEITALDDYSPSTITRILGRDGSVIGDFATERRVLIHYDQIPDTLRHAILAAEDAGFFEHSGLVISRMMLALVMDVLPGVRAPGRSTLTQQLARNLFADTVGFTPGDRRWERKIKESLVAIQIEKRYTKQEIFTFYCNQMYFGHGAYGVEAAARLYFDKPAQDLAVEEAALIAGLLQGNVRQSPYVNPDAALRRRNYAISRMATVGFLSRAEAEAALATPIVTRGAPSRGASLGSYFVEEVRKHIEARYGAKALYEQGLAVRTSLDPALQQAADAAVDRGLRRIDKRRGWRRPAVNVAATEHTVETFRHARWNRVMAAGDIVPAVVSRVDQKSGTGSSARVRIGGLTATLDPPSFQWTRRSHAADLLHVGDIVEVELTNVDNAAGSATVRLEQEPIVQGALVALDNRTGEVLAMVGGSSFAASKFNRATQAFRQLGSTFKPFLYAAAIDRGLTPASILLDAPITFDAGAGQPGYSPRNYDGTFQGEMTLRRALEQSRNVPAVSVMEMLGPAQVVAYSRQFGFGRDVSPYLSTALGASEATLLEVTSAYSAFPNHGIRMQPYLVAAVTNREGSVIEENLPQARDSIRADTAFVMTSLLRGVVQRGTAAAAASLDWPLAGKTGTVDDYTDAWFVGFDPDITVGVWVGHDEKKPLGPNESGSAAALPIWIECMRAYIGRQDRSNQPRFEPPANILIIPVDGSSGVPIAAGSAGAIDEAFISGTQRAPQ